MIYPRCQAENPPDARFCLSCGAALDRQQVGQGARLKQVATGTLQDLRYAYDAKSRLMAVSGTGLFNSNAPVIIYQRRGCGGSTRD